MSQYQVTSVFLDGLMLFKTKGWDTPLTLPPDGILVLAYNEASRVVLANGSNLRGIHIDYQIEGQSLATEVDPSYAGMLILCAEDGGAITVTPNDPGVPADDRITTSDGAATAVDCKHVQIFTQWVPSVGARRWRVNDWAGV